MSVPQWGFCLVATLAAAASPAWGQTSTSSSAHAQLNAAIAEMSGIWAHLTWSDFIGVKVGPFAMVDMYGTPHTEALHVVERYRLLDYKAAKEAEERGRRELFRIRGGSI